MKHTGKPAVLASKLKAIWFNRGTTGVVLVAAAALYAVSLMYNFGAPHPLKTLAKFAVGLTAVAGVLSNYWPEVKALWSHRRAPILLAFSVVALAIASQLIALGSPQTWKALVKHGLVIMLAANVWSHYPDRVKRLWRDPRTPFALAAIVIAAFAASSAVTPAPLQVWKPLVHYSAILVLLANIALLHRARLFAESTAFWAHKRSPLVFAGALVLSFLALFMQVIAVERWGLVAASAVVFISTANILWHYGDRLTRRYDLIAMGLVVGAFVLRIYNLGALSFWIDEAISGFAAKSLALTGQPILPSGMEYSRALPHLFIEALSFRLFGVNEFSARLPSALFGSLTIGLIYLFGKRLGRPIEGLIAAGIAVFMPWIVWYHRLGRMYALFQFLALLWVWLSYEIAILLRDGRPRNRVWWGWFFALSMLALTTFALSLSTHVLTLSMAPAVLALFVGTLLAAKHGGWRSLSAGKKRLFLSAAGFLMLTAAYAVVRLDLAQLLPFSAPPHIAGQNGAYYLMFFQNRFPFLFYLAIAGALALLHQRRRGDLFLLAALALPLLAMSQIPGKFHRYIFHLVPYFLLLSACGLTFVWYLAKQAIKRVPIGYTLVSQAAVAGLITVMLVSTMQTFTEVSNPRHGYYAFNLHANWKLASAYLDEHLSRDDVVITTSGTLSRFYLARSDYYWNTRSAAKMPVRQRNSELDVYTGQPQIKDIDSLFRLMDEEPAGWIITDVSRLGRLTQAQKDMMETRTKFHAKASDATIRVYSWGLK
jgi:hypothetical protein